jgi:hypothetical protein
MFAVFAIAAQSQKTPEDIIGQCPELTPIENLALLDVYPAEGTLEQKVLNAKKAKTAFFDKITALRKVRKDIAEKADAKMETAGKQDADRIAKQTTGRSLEDLQNMSDAEAMSLANKMVSNQLGSLGLGSMSLSDLQSLEGKSDEEILNAMSGIAPALTEMQTPTTGNPQGQSELKKIIDRWAEIDRLNNEDIADGKTKLKAIFEKYRAAIKEKSDILLPFQDGVGDQKKFDNGYEAALGAYRSVMYQYLVECYAQWNVTVEAVKKRIKTKLTDVVRYDNLMSQTLSSSGVSGVAKAMPSVGYDIAEQYLDAAESITAPPVAHLNEENN